MARRLFGHGELHLVVLALLQHQPMHGYQLLGELARLFAPNYKPSPGSVYPGIQALHDAGLVAGVQEGGRRVYHLTDSGVEALNKRRVELAGFEARTKVRVSAASDLDAALDDFAARVRTVGRAAGISAVQDVLDHAVEQIRTLPDVTGASTPPTEPASTPPTASPTTPRRRTT